MNRGYFQKPGIEIRNTNIIIFKIEFHCIYHKAIAKSNNLTAIEPTLCAFNSRSFKCRKLRKAAFTSDHAVKNEYYCAGITEARSSAR